MKVPATFLLALVFAFTTFSVAFGDFIPVTKAKVLGVGRIQSTLSETPVAVEDKFALPASESISEQAPELVEPIAREVAPLTGPEVVQLSAPESAAVNDGWRTTLATNYATPSDGFLNKGTASGELTTLTSMGVAHKSLPLGTVIEIYCPKSGLSCIATVNDRGPYDGRPDTFDFQMGVTAALGDNYGWYTVQYRIIG